MMYFYLTAAMTVGVFFLFTIGTYLFLPDYAYIFNCNSFLFGWGSCFIVFCIRFYPFTFSFIEKSDECAKLRKELDRLECKDNTLNGMYLSLQSYLDQYSQIIISKINTNLQQQANKLQFTLNELKTTPPPETDPEQQKRLQGAFATARQERALIKEITSQITLQGGGTVWDYVSQQLQAARQQNASERKAFTPSAPTKGKRAEKYKRTKF